MLLSRCETCTHHISSHRHEEFNSYVMCRYWGNAEARTMLISVVNNEHDVICPVDPPFDHHGDVRNMFP